jgi:hypothetical protein
LYLILFVNTGGVSGIKENRRIEKSIHLTMHYFLEFFNRV